ncbi:LAMI_0H15170g1_1 [Lachancea mirantina]|uniref:LAMI_0H15170g1_1 n=1 Tax=Lachancea mirantina TaxID=1230905 RepID=A0A1G4KID2_9SACH|nr:LAMI_0H15170g1_1 [Lachancea mirantina]
MSFNAQVIKDVAVDPEAYASYVLKDAPLGRDKIKVARIPRESFTAFRLIYASPTEISMNSRTVLLGGVPKLWYVQRTNDFLRSLDRLTNKGLWKRVEMVQHYASSLSHRESKSKARRDYWSREELPDEQEPDQGKASSGVQGESQDRHGYTVSKMVAGTQVPLRPKKAQTFAAPTSGRSGAWKKGHGLKERRTFATSERPDIDTTSTTITLNRSNTPAQDRFEPSLELDGRLADGTDADDSLSWFGTAESEPEPNIYNINSTTIRSTTEHSYSTSGQGSKPNALTSSLREEQTADVKISPELASLRKESKTSRYIPMSGTRLPSPDNNFSDADSTYSSISGPTFSSKPFDYSRNILPLATLGPIPEKLSREETDLILKLESHHKLLSEVKSLVFRTGKVLHFDKLHRDIRKIVDTEIPLPQRFFKKYKPGEVVKMEKMLVLVKSAISAKTPPLDFSEHETVETRVIERWKEYIVVARATGKLETPLFLQFYRHRNIPRFARINRLFGESHSSSMDFVFDTSCVTGFYSTLDKTIHVLRPSVEGLNAQTSDGSGNIDAFRIYILRCSSSLSASEWLNFFQSSGGIDNRAENLTVHIPDIDGSVSIPVPVQFQQEFKNQAMQEAESLEILILPRGYKVLLFPILRYLELSIQGKLLEAGFKQQVESWKSVNIRTGFCWKHYDRLEWCSGDQYDLLIGAFALRESHLLEYRRLSQYPRNVELPDGKNLTEPPPIEGFLLKLTDGNGNEKLGALRNAYSRLLYFFTLDGLLFFMQYYKSVPPLPQEAYGEDQLLNHDHDALQKALRNLPHVFEQNPYSLNLDSHIAWLNDQLPPEQFWSKDNYAFACTWRKFAQIVKAEGVIDLSGVIKVSKAAMDMNKKTEMSLKVLSGANKFIWKSQNTVDSALNSIIILTMRNGTKLKLLAPSPEVCDEWVQRLRQLCVYWKSRKKEDLQRQWQTKVANLRNLKIEEAEEANVSESTPKWVTDRGIADDKIYNVSAQSMMRPLMHTGFLYQKPRKHSAFRKFFAILIPGFVILYKCFTRSRGRSCRRITDYKHHLTITIEQCYIYSGYTTSIDLLKRDKEFDRLNPGTNPVPRIYSNGWRSGEEETSRCFTLWFGTKRAISSFEKKSNASSFSEDRSNNIKNARESLGKNDLPNNNDRGDSRSGVNTETEKNSEDDTPQDWVEQSAKNPNFLKLVARLGVTGKSMVFMAKSRQERDLWVIKISSELERLKHESVES